MVSCLGIYRNFIWWSESYFLTLSSIRNRSKRAREKFQAVSLILLQSRTKSLIRHQSAPHVTFLNSVIVLQDFIGHTYMRICSRCQTIRQSRHICKSKCLWSVFSCPVTPVHHFRYRSTGFFLISCMMLPFSLSGTVISAPSISGFAFSTVAHSRFLVQCIAR